MRIPDPKANTTTEAYLAYKAGYLEESELKPKLYWPYLHFDAWLAYWAGLTTDYPHEVGKNLAKPFVNGQYNASGQPTENNSTSRTAEPIAVGAGETYIFSQGGVGMAMNVFAYNDKKEYVGRLGHGAIPAGTPFTIPDGVAYITGWRGGSSIPNAQFEKGSEITDYEPYNDTPEMLCDEEALVAYLAGVTDTYPQEIKDPYDVRIVGYLKHLASIRWPEPDYPVNNEEFYLSTMEPTHTSSPEPSADIELDTAEGKIISVEVYGDTKQTTYTGKNLFDRANALANIVLIWTSGNNNAETGSITSDYISVDAGSSYNFNYSAAVFYYDSSKTLIGHLSTDGTIITTTGGGIFNTITVPSGYDIAYTRLVFRKSTAGNPSDMTNLDIMVNAGAELLPFEPYVGGIPSPNPDYPQDVNVVTGRQQINVSGKNLLDTEYSKVKNVPGNTSSGRTWDDTEKTMEYNGITYKFNEDGTITVSGSTGSAPSFLLLNDPIENLQEGSEYYMSGCPAGGSAASYSLRLYTTASTYTPEIGNGLTFTYGEQPFIRINISAGIVADDLVFKPMIVNSSDAGDEFVPFQGYESYEINLGKNLLDASTNVEGKRLDASGNLINDGEYFTTDFIKVSPSTEYTYSRYASGGGSTALCTWKADGTFIERIWWGGVNNIPATSFSFTTGPDVGLVKICDIKTLNTLQLELGSTSSSYAPYSTPIELCKIGDYQDYIYKNGDEWFLHKEVEKVILDGSLDETWAVQNSGTVNFFYRYRYITGYITSGSYSINNLATVSDINSSNTKVGYSIMNSDGELRVRYGTQMQTADWRTFLSSNNMIIYYALATPTDTQITDSTLISQLDALADADTYNEKTYIRVVANDPNLPALLSVEAYKY